MRFKGLGIHNHSEGDILRKLFCLRLIVTRRDFHKEKSTFKRAQPHINEDISLYDSASYPSPTCRKLTLVKSYPTTNGQPANDRKPNRAHGDCLRQVQNNSED